MMKIIDEALLQEFRDKQRCEWCGRVGIVQPHHLWARGMGGGGRLDVRINLIALCANCHSRHHQGGRPLKCDLLADVAAREGMMQDDIEREIYRLRRARK